MMNVPSKKKAHLAEVNKFQSSQLFGTPLSLNFFFKANNSLPFPFTQVMKDMPFISMFHLDLWKMYCLTSPDEPWKTRVFLKEYSKRGVFCGESWKGGSVRESSSMTQHLCKLVLHKSKWFKHMFLPIYQALSKIPILSVNRSAPLLCSHDCDKTK